MFFKNSNTLFIKKFKFLKKNFIYLFITSKKKQINKKKLENKIKKLKLKVIKYKKLN